MSVVVAQISLTGAIVGTAGNIPIGQAIPPPTIEQQMRPLQEQQLAGSILLVQNESGCVLVCTWPNSGKQIPITAGQWPKLHVPPGETQLNYVVVGLLPNAPIKLLLATLYLPGEIVDDTGTLGNSPIGGGVPLAVAQVINDGNPAPTTVVEATQSGNSSGSNAFIDNEGNMFAAELVLGPTYQKIFQTIAGAAVGADAVILGAAKSNFTHVQNELKVDKQSSFDANTIVTNGSGSLTLVKLLLSGGPSGSTGLIFWDSGDPNSVHMLTPASGASETLFHFTTYDGSAQQSCFSLGDQVGASHAWITHSGAVGGIASVATAGTYGVPLQVAQAKDFNITGTALTAIASYTVPNDGANHDLLILGQLYVGSGNTNNGVVTLEVAYTDPHQGALTLFFNVYGQTNLINGIAQAKGVGIQTEPRHIRCSPNTAAIVRYQNSAAGTISDFASAVITMMS